MMFADHLERPLARLRDWLERHNAALVAVILVVIGLMVLYKGIHGAIDPVALTLPPVRSGTA